MYLLMQLIKPQIKLIKHVWRISQRQQVNQEKPSKGKSWKHLLSVPTSPTPSGIAGYSVSSASHTAENMQCFSQCGINRCSCGQSLIKDLRTPAEIIAECSMGGRAVIRVTTSGVTTPVQLSHGWIWLCPSGHSPWLRERMAGHGSFPGPLGCESLAMNLL